MNVDALLTRQMELHTTTRRPPKTAEQLAELRISLLKYKEFLEKLEGLTTGLETDRVTLFQCFMHISVGGSVQFDKQAQSGAVPMHQAKVLTRSAAIDLEPSVRSLIPAEEVTGYVDLTKSLRTTLRVKVEDENDLSTVQKSVNESVEFLDFIFKCSKGDTEKMFTFYMSEDGPSFLGMVREADPELAKTLSVSTAHSAEPTVSSMLVHAWNPQDPVPSDECFVEELRGRVETMLANKTHASEKVVLARTLLNWIGSLSDTSFQTLGLSIAKVMEQPLSALCCDKRSSLSRIACETISLVSRRMSALRCVSVDESYWLIVRHLMSSLLNGVYVSVLAISQATDSAARSIVVDNNGRACIAEAVIQSLEAAKHNELRRKCLGYLSLCIVAAKASGDILDDECVSTLVAVAERFVEVGDSTSRRMARALCITLRTLLSRSVEIADPKVESWIETESESVKEALTSPSTFCANVFKT